MLDQIDLSPAVLAANFQLVTPTMSSAIDAPNGQLEHSTNFPIPAKTFHKFGQLPEKVQKLVWQFAAFLPQTVVVERIYLNDESTLAVHSSSDPLPRVCSLARAESRKYRTTILNGRDAHLFDCPSFFTNIAVDTILFMPTKPVGAAQRIFRFAPLATLADASTCGTWRVGDLFALEDSQQQRALEFPIAKRYAMSYLDWNNEVYTGGFGFYRLHQKLGDQQVHGLTLVVGLEQRAFDAGVRCVEPRDTPLSLLKHEFLFNVGVTVEEAPYITWRGMEEKVRQAILQYIAQRSAEKAAFLQVPTNTLDQWLGENGDDDACDDWSFINDIRFVEAVAVEKS